MCLQIVFTISLMSLSFLKQARNGSLKFEMVNGILLFGLNELWTWIRWSRWSRWLPNVPFLCIGQNATMENRLVYYVNKGRFMYYVYREICFPVLFLPFSYSLSAGEIMTSRISISLFKQNCVWTSTRQDDFDCYKGENYTGRKNLVEVYSIR